MTPKRHRSLYILLIQIVSSTILIMTYRCEVNDDNTKITICNFEKPTSLDNATSAQSCMSHYSRVIRERRNRRELRRKTNAIYPFVRLSVQVTNNPLVNDFFNGSTFF
ncbi:hypothetical protein RhiirC2_779103 [Rhizophagus irregularis]|uniref:Uncharacterized protein n=1 Tax=Rhizophagus irregularis TaxID=588596 RepID=A0A2N1NAP6_9GLOM|nr:hypothetical protein RhiirC2_779103 [Rhizophagus irregularis]